MTYTFVRIMIKTFSCVLATLEGMEKVRQFFYQKEISSQTHLTEEISWNCCPKISHILARHFIVLYFCFSFCSVFYLIISKESSFSSVDTSSTTTTGSNINRVVAFISQLKGSSVCWHSNDHLFFGST